MRLKYLALMSIMGRRFIRGGCSSAGRASDCDSECRGFKPRQPPHPSPKGAEVNFDGRGRVASAPLGDGLSHL